MSTRDVVAEARKLPTAKTWYQVDDQGDGVVRITEPNVSELLAANIWWIRGQTRDLVVDSGLGIVSLREVLPELFDNNPLLVLSHTHLDHSGGAHEFAQCAAHSAEAEYVRFPRPASLLGSDQQQQLGLNMADFGPHVAELPDVLINALPSAGYPVESYVVDAGHLTATVGQGHHIDLGNRTLEVLHLPGHTPGSISLLDHASSTLYSGDVVYDEGPLLDGLHDSSIPDYVATMRRLRDLPVDLVRPGHGHNFNRARLHSLASDYLKLREIGDP